MILLMMEDDTYIYIHIQWHIYRQIHFSVLINEMGGGGEP